MHFEILTILPDALRPYLDASILGRAAAAGVVSFGLTDLRPYGEGKHRQLDDAPYGGGSGMVMKPGPLVAAIEDARAAAPGARTRVVLMSPGGRPFSRRIARELAEGTDRLVLVCGRYEGVDARVEAFVDDELSIGDYVLTGGELAALVVVDAVARLVPGALGNEESTRDESFEGEQPRLEYPQYTRPRTFRGRPVPEVLLSGDHARIEAWRREQAEGRTRERRPDLLTGRESLDKPERGE